MKLKQLFSHWRREAKLQRSFRKDHSNNLHVLAQLKDKQKESLMPEKVNLLSDAMDPSKPIKYSNHFSYPDPEQLSKHMHQQYKNQINRQVPTLLEEARMSIEDKTLKWEENRLMANEAKKFAKVYFKKNETARLLLVESRRPENYLPLQDLEEKGESFYAQLNRENQNFQHHLHELNNQRISRLVSDNSEQESCYKYLIQSRILDQSDEIRNHVLQLVQQVINETTDVVQNSNVLSNPIIQSPQELSQQVINIVEDKTQIDEDSLQKFFQLLIQQSTLNKENINQHLQSITVVQNYQTQLFDTFRNKDINLRKKGKLEFKTLTEEEQLKYIKFNLPTPNLVFRAIETFEQYKDAAPTVYPQLLAKLSSFHMSKELSYLAIIQESRFRQLLWHTSRVIQDLDDETFASAVYSISKLKPKTQMALYPRLSLQIGRKISNELLRRVHYLSPNLLAMIVGSLIHYPIITNVQLQQVIATRINNIDLQQVQIFEVESYLKFFSDCYDSVIEDNKDVQMKLLQKLVDYSDFVEGQIPKFDKFSLRVFLQSSVKFKDQRVVQLYDKLALNMKNVISQLNGKDLSLTFAALATLGIDKKNPIVEYSTKRLVDIVLTKTPNLYDEELSNISTSLAAIDTQNFYSQLKPYEKLLMQTCFFYAPFTPKSPQYLPYTKILRTVDQDLKQFTKESLIKILKSLTLIQHQNKLMIIKIVNQLIGYNPLEPDLEKKNQLTDEIETLGMALQTYALINCIDDIVPKLIDKTLNQVLALQNKVLKAETILQLFQTFFNLYINDTNPQTIILLSMVLLQNITLYGDHLSPTFYTCSLYFILGLYSKNMIKKQPKNEEISIIVNELIDRIIQAENLIFEQQYLITLSYLMLKKSKLNVEKADLLKSKGLVNSKAIIDYHQNLEDKKINDIGTERYTKNQAKDLIKKELEQMGHKVQTNVYLELENIVYDKVDLYLLELQRGIKLMSLNQMIDNNNQLQLRGHDEVLRYLSKYKVIVIEEYNRATSQNHKDPETTKQFLQQYIK